MSQLTRISIGAAIVALIAETGAKNLLMTALVTLGTPATATGFVYEVVQMRHATLEREAEDRAKLAGTVSPVSAPDPVLMEGPPPTLAALNDTESANGTDLPHKLRSMVIAREHFVDIYGGSAEAVAPAYQTIAKQMLDADDQIFVKIAAEKQSDPAGFAAELAAPEARLRALHESLEMLSPAPRVASADPVATDKDPSRR